MCSNYGLLYPKSRRFLLLRGPILCVRDLEVIQVRVGKGILQLQLTPQATQVFYSQSLLCNVSLSIMATQEPEQ